MKENQRKCNPFMYAIICFIIIMYVLLYYITDHKIGLSD